MNEGGTLMLNIVTTIFYATHDITPRMASCYMCVVALPEALTFIWGCFVDSYTRHGRRPHMLGASALQIIMSFIIFSNTEVSVK